MVRTKVQIRAELPPDLEEAERETLVTLALRMEASTPQPSAEFRDSLRQELAGRARPLPHRHQAAATTQPRLAVAYAGAGGLLLAIAGLGVAGVGPFAAG